jgi:hypothetical protein
MNPHFPDMKTQAGLCDVMALGNICELGTLLDRLSYCSKVGPEEEEECAMARWHYRQVKIWFADKYKIRVKDYFVHPMSVFRRSLVAFMAALVESKYLRADQAPEVQALELKKRVLGFINLDHPELAGAFSRMMDKGGGHFAWAGPSMRIKRRKRAEELVELLDFEDFPLFPSQEGDGSEIDRGEDPFRPSGSSGSSASLGHKRKAAAAGGQ